MERTIAGRQGTAPLEVGLTLERLRVAQRVPSVAVERHQGSHIKVVAMALSVDRDTGIHAVI